MTQFHESQYLIDKINSWTMDKSTALWGTHYKAFPTKAKMVFEEANTADYEGFVFYGPDYATYMNANGEEWILNGLNTDTFPTVFNASKHLSNLCANAGLRMINVGLTVNLGNPKPYQTLSYNNRTWHYYKLTHPDNDLGVHNPPTASTVDTWCNTLLNEVESILPLIVQTTEELNVGYPQWRIGDALNNSGGRYFRWFRDWDRSKELMYYALIGAIEAFEQTFTTNLNGFDLPANFKAEAEARWSSALNM